MTFKRLLLILGVLLITFDRGIYLLNRHSFPQFCSNFSLNAYHNTCLDKD